MSATPKRFWGRGILEILEPIRREMDALHNIITDAGMASVGPQHTLSDQHRGGATDMTCLDLNAARKIWLMLNEEIEAMRAEDPSSGHGFTLGTLSLRFGARLLRECATGTGAGPVHIPERKGA